MAIIDPEGLFGGDRLRRCSNQAQLHWVRLYLASDGFGRLEINYARIIGRAYATFNPLPAEEEITGYIQEYATNFLLFLYAVSGRTWGQWDTRPEMLPRYKTAVDRRSPPPSPEAFTQWRKSYMTEITPFPKSSQNFSGSLNGYVRALNPYSTPSLIVPSTTDASEPKPDVRDEHFERFVTACAAARMSTDDFALGEALAIWRTLSLPERLAAVKGIDDRVACAEFDPGFEPLPQNFLKKTYWKRPLRPKLAPARKPTNLEKAQQSALRKEGKL